MGMRFWSRFRHFYFRHHCLSDVAWVGNELRCALCGAPIAITGLNNGTNKPYYIFKRYRKYSREIEELIYEYAGERSDLATDRDGGWNAIHDYIKNALGSIPVLFMETGAGGVEEDWKESQSENAGDENLGVDE